MTSRANPVSREQGVAADGENTTEHSPLLQQAVALQNGEITRNICFRMIISKDQTRPRIKSEGVLSGITRQTLPAQP